MVRCASSHALTSAFADCGTIAAPPTAPREDDLPSPRSTRARVKDTSRVDARRRHREQQRTDVIEPDPPEAAAAQEAAVSSSRPRIGLPDVRADLLALPGMFREKPALFLPFLIFLVAFLVDVGLRTATLPADDMAGTAGVLFWQFTYLPIPFIVFAIGGFLAPRGAWLLGLLLGLEYAALVTITSSVGVDPSVSPDLVLDVRPALLEFWSLAVVVGTLSGTLGAWYAGFLRNSRERARANQLARERERALKAKEQARLDREEARKARSATRQTSTPTRSSRSP